MDNELAILIHCIANDRFLKEVLPIIRPQYFKLSYSRIIFSWIDEFYTNFSCAMKKNITDVYKQKCVMLQEDDSEANDEIKLFLTNLSNRYDEYDEATNIDFLVKKATEYLNTRSLEVLEEKIKDALLSNDIAKAQNEIANYKRVEKPTGQGVDLLKDTDKIVSALTNEHDVLFAYPGAVGELAGTVNRGDFVSFFGPSGRGKTQVLWWNAELAMAGGCKVLFFTLEMTENEIIKSRAIPSLTGAPKTSKVIKSATFVMDEVSGKYNIIQKEQYKEGVDPDNTFNLQKKLKRLYRKGNIKIIFPPDTLTVTNIESTLDNLYYYENYLPDVVIIDYADYMAPSKGFKNAEYRHVLNDIWKGLSDLRLKRNIAIITASHTEVKTFNADVLISHASEDKRKVNHITMGIGLNQTEKEHDDNIMRMGIIKLREGRKTSKQAVCLQCLDVARPCIASKMRDDVNMKEYSPVPEKTGNNYGKRHKNVE